VTPQGIFAAWYMRSATMSLKEGEKTMKILSRMLFLLILVGMVFIGGSARFLGAAESSDETQIRALLQTQTDAWNRGDIDAFMAGYWKSEETAFVGASGIARGWQAVQDRYKKNYPDRRAMGHLTFSGLEVHMLCSDAAFAIGEFHLERENDKPSGIFTLNFRKVPEGWRIVADHTTAFASPKP
jgi:ketosteroid isomerase-like protein